MSVRYRVPAIEANNPHVTQLMIKKSRFIAQTCFCDDSRSARAFIMKIKALHPDATHNCWAFTAQAPGFLGAAGSSDDGEPHGTAGRPILQALLDSGIGEICMVISRWFGGVKLGTGGLARAYRQTALENLANLPIREKVPLEWHEIKTPYCNLDALKRYLENIGAKIVAENYGAEASLRVGVPLDAEALFSDDLARLSGGVITIAGADPEKV